MRVPLSLFAALFLALPAERKQGNPPDNLRVAFMAKSFGDAMVIDLNTREIRCLTCNVPAAVFLRVMHLVTGDYILIGPDHFENIRVSRTRDNELWFLSKERGSRPIKLGQKMSEGAGAIRSSFTGLGATPAIYSVRCTAPCRRTIQEGYQVRPIWTSWRSCSEPTISPLARMISRTTQRHLRA